MNNVKNLIAVTISTLLLASCGGSNDDDDENELIGVFLDSAVSGLAYSTGSVSGVTNDRGEFRYNNGEMITFSIGQLQLASVVGAQVITPLDVFDTDSPTDRRVVNLSALLQSLDENSNPSDGISITESISSAAPNSSEVDFDVASEEFSQNVAVINLVSANGSVLQGEFQTVRHLQESLVENGTWTVIAPDEWADLSRDTTHIYDNGARYYYREDGVRLSVEPWLDGLQETTWFVADDEQFCEVSTSGPTFCFGAAENFILSSDGNGTYLYSDPTFTSSFNLVQGNGLNITSTDTGRQQVDTDNIAELFDKQLFLDDDFIIVRSNGTFDGTWSDEPIAGTYEMRDGYFCRVLTEFFDTTRLNEEDCQLWESNGNTVKGTRARGTGNSFEYTITN